MPNLDGIQTRLKRYELSIQIPVAIVTTFDVHKLVIKATQAGAKGYLLKNVSSILAKLGVLDRTRAVVKAIGLGLI